MSLHRCLRTCLGLLILFTQLIAFVPTAPVLAKQTSPAVAAVPWLDAQESDGIVYLLYASPNLIKRYQIGTQAWLSDILLADTPTAFRPAPDVLYIAFGRRVAKFNLDGTGETHLLNTMTDIISLHLVNQLLLVNYSSPPYTRFISFNLKNNALVDNKSNSLYAIAGDSIAPSIGKLFGRTIGISPSDIAQVSFSSEGLIGNLSDSPYHGVYPEASRTWVSPDERMVIDNAGTIYNTADLTYRNNLGGQADDLIFYGDLPVVLRGGTLIAFTNTFLETGRIDTAHVFQRIFLSGQTIYAFYSDAQGPQVEKIAVSTLNPAVPGAPIDPNGLIFTPDTVALGKDETLYLLVRKYQSIFRWSVSQRRYLSTIPLRDVPVTMAYATNENLLYTAYPDGSIYRMRLDESLLETSFSALSATPCGLAAAGSFLFTCHVRWTNYYTYSAIHSVLSSTGDVLSTGVWSDYSNEYVWHAGQQRMYFFSGHSWNNDTLSWEEIDANGVIGGFKDVLSISQGWGPPNPLHVKADGSIILLGTGLIYDGQTYQLVNTLSNKIAGAGWKGDTLFTLRSKNNDSEIQKWFLPNYGIERSQTVSGSPLNLFPIQEGWLVITNQSGKTRFSIWSDDLTLRYAVPLVDFSATPSAGDVPVEVHFTNLSSEGPYTASLWDFGDGATSPEKDPIHSYTKSGYYTVKLTVSGPGGSDTLKIVFMIHVRPVAANFSVSVSGGDVPLNVQFTNQTTGQVASFLWDFGDGVTSTEQNPAHTYLKRGSYTVTLTVDGSYGQSTLVKTDLIHAILHQSYYAPAVISPPLLAPGVYVFDNLCQQYPVYQSGTYLGQMRECIPSVEIKADATMYFNFSWTVFRAVDAPGCVSKKSDAGNKNMYIRDWNGYRYDHIQVGGVEEIPCMESGVSYFGWFKFPAAKTKNPAFVFYDDTGWIRISPVILRAVQ